MTKKWTTLVEDQTEKANASIAKVLEEIDQSAVHSGKNRTVAVLMAIVGLVLIGIGVWPFFQTSEDLQGDISTFDDSSNIFSGEAEPLDEVLPADTQEDSEAMPSDMDSDSEETPSMDELSDLLREAGIDSNFLPVDDVVDDDLEQPETNKDPDTAAESDIFLPEVPYNTVTDIPTNTPSEIEIHQAPSFPQNVHIGKTDKNVMVFGENTASPNTAKEPAHAAAGEMTESGPGTWGALIFALALGIYFRRKTLFA